MAPWPVIDIDENGGGGRVYPDLGRGALELDGLHLVCDADDGVLQDIFGCVVVLLCLVFGDFLEHRFAVVLFEQKHSTLGWQAQLGSDERGVEIVLLAGFDLFGGGLLHLFFLGCDAGGVPLVGGLPIDEGNREFLPLAALGAEISDAVAVFCPLGRRLVAAVGQDEALYYLGGSAAGEQQRQDEGQVLPCTRHIPKTTLQHIPPPATQTARVHSLTR